MIADDDSGSQDAVMEMSVEIEYIVRKYFFLKIDSYKILKCDS